MAKFVVTILEGEEEAVSFTHETPLPHFTIDDEEQIFEAVRAAVAYLGMEP